MKTVEYKCPSCGATVEFSEKVKFCEYCGSPVSFVDENEININYVDQAKVQEIELEKMKFEASQREKEGIVEDYRAWQKKRNIWVIGLGILFALTEILDTASMTSLFSALLIFGGIYIYYTWPNRSKGKKESSGTKRYVGKQGYSERRYSGRRKMPWPYSGFGIFIIGLFTGGIYWIVGIILRILWTNKYWNE